MLGDWRADATIKDHPALASEVEEMRTEVARCKEIVAGILDKRGESARELVVREALLRHRYRATSAKNGTVEDLQERWASPVYCEPL